MNSIGIIGTGRLGLSFALLCAQKGYNVLGSDKNREYVDSLNNKTYKTIEPHIEDYLTTTRFRATTDNMEVVRFSDLLFMFVPTPSLSTGEYDHRYIDEVVEELVVSGLPLIGKTLVIGCTVMPGYTQTIADKLKYTCLQVAYNPEFIAQGDIVNGLKKADMILIGANDEKVVHQLTGVYRTIMDKEPVINSMSPTAAEITKISINCFLTMKIAYRNVIGEIAINSGIEDEVNTILKAIGDDKRIGHLYLLYYGFGYGGPCLPRDMSALGIHAKNVGLIPLLQDTIDGCNNNHAVYLKNYYIKKNSDKEVPFLFTQLTYKKGVDMLVESQQYRLCKDLLSAGYKVDITEQPSVIEHVKGELKEYAEQITWGTVNKGYKIEI